MKRRRVGLDIDGVLLQARPLKFLQFCRDQFGWKVDIEAFNQTHDWELAIPERKGIEVGEVFAQYLIQHPESQTGIPGARAFLEEFSELCEYHLITARQSMLAKPTLDALVREYPGVRFLSITWDAGGIKGINIRALELIFYAEDSASEIVAIVQHPDVSGSIVHFPNPWLRFLSIEHPQVHQLEACKQLLDCAALTPDCYPTLQENAWQEAGRHLKTLLRNGHL